MARRFPNPARAARNAAQRLYDIRMGMDALSAEAAELRREVAALRSDVSELRAEGTDGRATALETARVNQAEALRVMRLLHDDEPANRQRVWRLRETPEYALAFEEAEPLVSFNLATYTNLDGLMERALPSVLGQTYERIEVIVVGDAAAPEIERAVKGLKDPRVRFYNQTYRGPYDEAGERLWYVAGGPPSNEGMRLARGRWLCGMDDDDVCRANRVELLLAAARERNLEFCYGQLLQRHPDPADDKEMCRFPPELGAVGLQASIMHAGLRFVCAELGDAIWEVPGDWSRIRRMMRLGVRMGMIDDVVVEYFPGELWRGR